MHVKDDIIFKVKIGDKFMTQIIYPKKIIKAKKVDNKSGLLIKKTLANWA